MKTFYCYNCDKKYAISDDYDFNEQIICPDCDEPLSEYYNDDINTVIDPRYIPKCPTCGCPDVEKISLSSKVVGGALFGLFSSNVRKTMHCKNCGYKW